MTQHLQSSLFASLLLLLAPIYVGAQSIDPNAMPNSSPPPKGPSTASDNELRGPSLTPIAKSSAQLVDANGCWQTSEAKAEGLLLNRTAYQNDCAIFVSIPNFYMRCPSNKKPQNGEPRLLILEPDRNPSKVQFFNAKFPNGSAQDALIAFHKTEGSSSEFILYIGHKADVAVQQFRFRAYPVKAEERDACLTYLKRD